MMKFACIPAYNEEDTISDLVKSAKKFVDKVIVCDDGSSDATFDNAKSAGALVLKHKKNLGKGTALKTLFQKAKELGFKDAQALINKFCNK